MRTIALCLSPLVGAYLMVRLNVRELPPGVARCGNEIIGFVVVGALVGLGVGALIYSTTYLLRGE